MTKTLFEDFEAVSAKAWKQNIQVDLKGEDYNDALIWKNTEGIDVKPFYHADEFLKTSNVYNLNPNSWKIGEHINVNDEKTANSNAINAIKCGITHLIFNLNSENISIPTLLKNIDLNTITVDLKCSFNPLIFTDVLKTDYLEYLETSKLNLQTDCIGHLTKHGNWHQNLNEDLSNFVATVKTTSQFTVNLEGYQNAGATIVQQLAYGMAHANEYLNILDDKVSDTTKQALTLTFNVAIGSNYFFEIAKLRALRLLWQTLAKAYTINTICTIIATPSKRNKTIYDYNVNMLRTTTECMSAILGGANSVFNLPYDALFHNPNDFGTRISRNQLLILKHESYFDKVSNPADGSYYIEKLTQQISDNALALFKDIENQGGFLKLLKSGTIQRKIKESAAKTQADFETGNLSLIGTNKHPNANDKMKSELEISPFLKIKNRKTLIEPIIEKRLAETLEQNRLHNE